MSSPSDLLSAESLMFGVLGVVFGLWYQEISDTIAAQVPPHKEDREPVEEQVRRTLGSKAIPLAVASLLVFLTFAPNAFLLVWKSVVHFNNMGFSNISNYNAVDVALVLVSFMNCALLTYNVFQVVGLLGLERRIKT